MTDTRKLRAAIKALYDEAGAMSSLAVTRERLLDEALVHLHSLEIEMLTGKPWVNPTIALPEKWTPVLCALPSLGTSYRRVVAEFAPGGESYHKRGWYIHGNYVADEKTCVGWMPLPPFPEAK